MKLGKGNMRGRAQNTRERSLMTLGGVGISTEVAIRANRTSKTVRWVTVQLNFKRGRVKEPSSDLEADHQRTLVLAKVSLPVSIPVSTRVKSDPATHGPKDEIRWQTTLARIKVAGATSSSE